MSPVDAPDVSIVMPCLNEAATVRACVRQALDACAAAGLTAEAIVVDNGSTDGSDIEAMAAGATLVRETRRGYGHAYRRGFASARGRHVVMGDADGTYDFSTIPAFVERLEAGAEYVTGSRLRGTIAPGAMPWLHRRIGNPALTWVLNRLFGLRVSDAHCGLRAFRADALRRLDLRSGGMELASELAIKAGRRRLAVAEIPIDYAARPPETASKLRSFRDGWRHLRFMLLFAPSTFIAPGLALLAVGLTGMAALVWGPLPFPGHELDVHFLVLASLLTLLGVEALTAGVYASVFAHARGLEPAGPRVSAFMAWFTLERGLLIGGAAFMAGFGLDLAVLVVWFGRDFGPLHMVAPAVAGGTLMVLGAHTIIASFLLGLMGSSVVSGDEPRWSAFPPE
jgi:hypothetical protein